MAKLTQDETIAAIFSYLGILVLIPMLAIKRKNDFINFHIRQGLVLLIAEIIVMVVLWILVLIPAVGYIFAVLSYIISILFLIVALIALVKALMGEKWEIPVINQFSGKLKI